MNEDVGSCQECSRPFQADDVIVPLPITIAGEARQMRLCAACRARLSGATLHQAAMHKPDDRTT